MLDSFIDTALIWGRMIADYRPSADSHDDSSAELSGNPAEEWTVRGLDSFSMMQV